MRRGEISALRYEDIDSKALTVSVTKSYAQDDHNEWKLKSPKPYAGTRTISVSANLIERLMHNQIDPYRVYPFHPEHITKHSERLCKRLGITCRFHDLRHYNVSIMLALNVPDKYAMERLGQATPGMIEAVYQHIMSDKQQEVGSLVNSAADALMVKCDMHQEKPLKIKVLQVFFFRFVSRHFDFFDRVCESKSGFLFCGSIRISPTTPLSAAIGQRPVKADECNGVAHMAVSVRSQVLISR